MTSSNVLTKTLSGFRSQCLLNTKFEFIYLKQKEDMSISYAIFLKCR
jgi:hypothetical protein